MAAQEQTYLYAILLGFAFGALARICMLRSDYRNHPSYPHGYVIHLSLGAIAAILAALAVPAILEEELTAITFLVLCAQQFREIRTIERESLMQLEAQALVPRGAMYIEGIAAVFESRNYLVMLVSFLTSAACTLWGLVAGVAAGSVLLGVAMRWMRGRNIGQIARVQVGQLHFAQSLLCVEDVVLMNVGSPHAREQILAHGVGLVVDAYDAYGRAVLDHPGQRQAILHTVASLLGSKMDVGEQEWTPMARKNSTTGRLGIFLMPDSANAHRAVEAVNCAPVLESAAIKPYGKRG